MEEVGEMENEIISVVIPAYNAERYLFSCVKSIQTQVLNNIEIIIINDGSTDGTEQIIDELKCFDNRVKKINVYPNAGVANARNMGIREASGKYIVFADADDYLPSRAYEFMYQEIRNQYADVIVGDYYEVIDNKSKYYCNTNESNREFVMFFAGGVVWNKIYRKDFLISNKIYFKKYNSGEDTLFLGDVYIKNPVVYHLSEDVYHHFQRTTDTSTTQLTRQFNAENLRDYFDCGEQIYTLPFKCSKDDVFIEYMRYLRYVYHFWLEIPDVEEKKETFPELQRFTAIFSWDMDDREQRFIDIFHEKPMIFQKITYDTYMSFSLS